MDEKNFGIQLFALTQSTQTEEGTVDSVLNPEQLTGKILADEQILPEVSSSDRGNDNTVVSSTLESLPPLLNREETTNLRSRWNEIQGKFVDEPRLAVQQADALLTEVVDKIIQIYSNEHAALESQWNQGMNVSTEDLRKTFQHYHSFFNRLVI